MLLLSHVRACRSMLLVIFRSHALSVDAHVRSALWLASGQYSQPTLAHLFTVGCSLSLQLWIDSHPVLASTLGQPMTIFSTSLDDFGPIVSFFSQDRVTASLMQRRSVTYAVIICSMQAYDMEPRIHHTVSYEEISTIVLQKKNKHAYVYINWWQHAEDDVHGIIFLHNLSAYDFMFTLLALHS